MKKLAVLLVAVLCLSSRPARAQSAAVPSVEVSAPSGDMTLGGVPRLIAQKIQEAKPCGIADGYGRLGGGAYIPTWTFHDMAGRSFVEVGNIGYRAIQGEKPSVMLLPVMVNFVALSGRAWDFQWARDHVTRSKYPDIFVGVGPIVPIDGAQVVRLKLNQPKGWLVAVASVRF